MDGLLLIDKPKGWTSFDVVAKVRGALRQAQSEKLKAESQRPDELSALDFQPSARSPKVKVGHTGTLDPLATGLLVLTVGTYCKRAQEFSKLDKIYEVTMKLCETSTTGDEEGEKTKSKEQRVVSNEELQNALEKFRGEIMQTPPIYSAIKVDGQRAYKLARAGKEVKLEPRQVTVYSLQITDYTYPEVKFITKVSSGTYVRSLVEDIGNELRTGAYMADLRRTSVGEFTITNAHTLDALSSIEPELVQIPEIIK